MSREWLKEIDESVVISPNGTMRQIIPPAVDSLRGRVEALRDSFCDTDPDGFTETADLLSAFEWILDVPSP